MARGVDERTGQGGPDRAGGLHVGTGPPVFLSPWAPLEYLRPFVAPLFAWATAVGHRGSIQVPWSIAFIFEFLSAELLGEGRVSQVRPVAADLGIAFRADAKAE